MNMNTATLVWRRPAPWPGSATATALRRRLAGVRDAWVARRTQARWRRELRTLDARTLRDIGLTRAMIDVAGRPAGERD